MQQFMFSWTGTFKPSYVTLPSGRTIHVKYMDDKFIVFENHGYAKYILTKEDRELHEYEAALEYYND
jgi:hypothetical protein